ncbi:hypothetical protein AFLA_010521 [Aspergillus flavus NRRL3357]|nr:hypothetical protein AFLA_010521 [Aspergillus flavus NRRL3357]
MTVDFCCLKPTRFHVLDLNLGWQWSILRDAWGRDLGEPTDRRKTTDKHRRHLGPTTECRNEKPHAVMTPSNGAKGLPRWIYETNPISGAIKMGISRDIVELFSPKRCFRACNCRTSSAGIYSLRYLKGTCRVDPRWADDFSISPWHRCCVLGAERIFVA